MRKLSALLLFILPLIAEDVPAQSGGMVVMCAECRDPLKYPEDWANFAFNQVYGPGSWVSLDQADDFHIVNLQGDRVYVDIDFVMGGIRVLGNTLPLWPRNLLMVTLALPNGQIVQYLRSVFQHPLPVPAPPGPNSNPGAHQIPPDHRWPEQITPFEWDYPELVRGRFCRVPDRSQSS